MVSEFTEFTSFANRLADAARACMAEFAGRAPEPIQKSDGSPVTKVDRTIEDRLREIITDTYPEHGIVGEERGTTGTDKEFIWVIDPIDGTLPFLAGFPVYGTLLALVRGDAPVVGIIEMPVTGERWVGCQGLPTTHNGNPVKTRACDDLSVALMSTSNPSFYGEADRPALERMQAATRWGVFGGSCLAYGQIASGRIDVGFDVSFDPTDYLPLVPVITGAGGVITDWDGNALTLRSGDRFLAAGDSGIHSKTLAVLAGIETR